MDFSQIELRCLAGMSHDSTMLDAYATGKDLHQMTADAGRVIRAHGKTFNFAMIYGAGDMQLRRKTKVSFENIKLMRQGWNSLYPQAKAFIDKLYYYHGPYVETDFGRRMAMPRNITNMSRHAYEAHCSKAAVNYPIQGTAADIIKRAMLQTKDLDIRVQVHDELVADGECEFPDSLSHIHPEIHTPFSVYKDYSWK